MNEREIARQRIADKLFSETLIPGIICDTCHDCVPRIYMQRRRVCMMCQNKTKKRNIDTLTPTDDLPIQQIKRKK